MNKFEGVVFMVLFIEDVEGVEMVLVWCGVVCMGMIDFGCDVVCVDG